jgi:hypothetical protein
MRQANTAYQPFGRLEASGLQLHSGPRQDTISRRLALIMGIAVMAGFAAGCRAVPVSVGNPIPGMTTVAVAPFFNLSAEPSVDGRRFALAYYTELQKTANYQVIPVGIVESAIQENQLNMSSPADAIKLAKILDADAVVVGAVTHYDPYYPPQMGVHVRWFSPRGWLFYPGIPMGEEEKGIGYPPEECPPPAGRKPTQPVVRGQSAGGGRELDRSAPFGDAPLTLAQSQNSSGNSSGNTSNGPIIWPPGSDLSETWPGGGPRLPVEKPNGAFCVPGQDDTIQPIMSYTRFFDGADCRLIEQLRGYYVLRGDMRSGGWEAYLHRSDDFLQFASFVMVVEMLELHGGPLKTEKVFMYGR